MSKFKKVMEAGGRMEGRFGNCPGGFALGLARVWK